MSTCLNLSDPFRCPTKWDLFEQITALLPRGRAWQSHEDVLEIPASGGDVWPADNPWGARLTGLQQFWAAYAEVLEHLHQRACALLSEFFCVSASETLPEWAVEFGFPDACEPYDTVCEKATDVPGARCADLVATALRRGWVIECEDCGIGPYQYPVAGHALAGCSVAGCGCTTGLNIRVLTALSPAYQTDQLYPVAGFAVAGCSDLCGPRVEALTCLIERIRPAHLRVTYEVI